jgi:hypothetical protein
MSIWSNINKRSEGTVERQEDINPDLDHMRSILIKWVAEINQLIEEITSLSNQLDTYFYEGFLSPVMESPGDLIDLESIKPILKSKDIEAVKKECRQMFSRRYKLYGVKKDYERKIKNAQAWQQKQFQEEEERRRMKEEAERPEREKAVKEQKFLDTLETSGCLTLFTSVLAICAYLIIILITKKDLTWVLGVLTIFLGIGLLILEIREEGFNKMKQHIKKYKR